MDAHVAQGRPRHARCSLGLSHGLADHCHNEASDVGACLWI